MNLDRFQGALPEDYAYRECYACGSRDAERIGECAVCEQHCCTSCGAEIVGRELRCVEHVERIQPGRAKKTPTPGAKTA